MISRGAAPDPEVYRFGFQGNGIAPSVKKETVS